MLRNIPCRGEQLHLDLENDNKSLNYLLLLLTLLCALGNSVRGSHKQRILFPLKMFVVVLFVFFLNIFPN